MKKWIAPLLLAVMVFSLTGCGETVVELTTEEEEQITAYAAEIITKYNKKQPDGIQWVYIPEEEETEEEEAPAASTEEEVPEGYYDPTDFEELPTTTGTNKDAVNAADTSVPEMSLNDILKFEGFDIRWTGTKVSDDFLDPTSTMLFTPDAGKRYVLLTITVTNTTEEAKICDVPEMTPDFKLIVNGSERISASATLAETDFQNFQQTVEPGESVDTQLFFQRKATDIADNDTYSLEATLNGVTGRVSEE